MYFDIFLRETQRKSPPEAAEFLNTSTRRVPESGIRKGGYRISGDTGTSSTISNVMPSLKGTLRECRQGGWPAGRYDLRRRNP